MVIDRSEQELVPVMPSDEAIAATALDPAKPILEKVSRGFLKTAGYLNTVATCLTPTTINSLWWLNAGNKKAALQRPTMSKRTFFILQRAPFGEQRGLT